MNYIYGELNQLVQKQLYKGVNTDTAVVNVDNTAKTISVETIIDESTLRDIITVDYIIGTLGYVPADEVQVEAHIDDTENPHEVDKYDVGLGNVNDTSDMDKPISNATQDALDLKIEAQSYATINTGGTVKINPDLGIGITNSGADNNGTIYVVTMSSDDIDSIWEDA